MIQAQWGNFKFSISRGTLRQLRELSESFKVKKKMDKSSSTVIITGAELQSYSLDFNVIKTSIIDPLEEYKNWRTALGSIAPLLLEGTLFGPENLMLSNVELSSDNITSTGEILTGTITVSFEEYSEPKGKYSSASMKYISRFPRQKFEDTASAVEKLKLKVIYNDKDITDDIDINSCIHNMYACSQSDLLEIKFNDVKKLWDSWSSDNNDQIAIIYGIAKTGRMFINDVKPQNGLMTLWASSAPNTCDDKHNKSWENVKFSQLGKEIADRQGLEFEMFGVEDQLYSYVRQENESDFKFLQKRCELESCAFLVYDGKLVIYSEEYLEKQDAALDVELAEDADYEYSDNELKGYGSIVIKNGNFTGKYSSSNDNPRCYEQPVKTYIGSQNEADRFAKGILRQLNKKQATGYWRDVLMRELSAGSVLNLKTVGANSWNGKVLVSHIRQDYINNSSKIDFRRV